MTAINCGLRVWRQRERLTLEEIGDLTGVSPAMLSRAERGERQFSRRLKVLLARRLGVPIRELFPIEEVPDEDGGEGNGRGW